ncbi:bifunctional adenosylcobinamide kinase/adenosylcobinamide-phosphate guanylyltransferase [Planococcus sp. YIM B11945]|uniref:bifunctional adenosylcobinamide kinase/adenosylcobinamide-phosphate guanylyltransferase n=1 Tax=Planococcus sp. YIM B11945 TaxID=3435410 RepID=UPI003D7D4576
MHIVFGGAFNGKRDFVKEQLKNRDWVWHEAELPKPSTSHVVIAGVENWVKRRLEEGMAEAEILQAVQSHVLENTHQIWILTDINRGIVPLDPIERQQRDTVGRLYQWLFKQAASVTRIWYGIPELLKGDEGIENVHEDRR